MNRRQLVPGFWRNGYLSFSKKMIPNPYPHLWNSLLLVWSCQETWLQIPILFIWPKLRVKDDMTEMYHCIPVFYSMSYATQQHERCYFEKPQEPFIAIRTKYGRTTAFWWRFELHASAPKLITNWQRVHVPAALRSGLHTFTMACMTGSTVAQVGKLGKFFPKGKKLKYKTGRSTLLSVTLSMKEKTYNRIYKGWHSACEFFLNLQVTGIFFSFPFLLNQKIYQIARTPFGARPPYWLVNEPVEQATPSGHWWNLLWRG